jgi:hypothetical protein
MGALGPDGVGKGLGNLIANSARQPLDRGVGGDLQSLSRTCVLRVLENFLLSSPATDEVKRRLTENKRLPDNPLHQPNAGMYGAAAPSELIEPAPHDLNGHASHEDEIREPCGSCHAGSWQSGIAARSRGPSPWHAPRWGTARSFVESCPLVSSLLIEKCATRTRVLTLKLLASSAALRGRTQPSSRSECRSSARASSWPLSLMSGSSSRACAC